MKQQGIVRWFSNTKGYGFIKPDNSQEEVFVHYQAIQAEGYKSLRENQRVAFKLEQGKKGLHALEVDVLESAAETTKEKATAATSDIAA